jgi:hypothetical protein
LIKLDVYQIKEKIRGKQQTERKRASYIYQDDQTKQIKEIPLSKLDSAGASAYINPAKLIHNSIFG